MSTIGTYDETTDVNIADINGDGNVDVSDLLLLLAAFGTAADGDCNGDGVTDVSDLLVLLSQFGS